MKPTDIGVYVHIPFCEAKCGYCDFVSYVGKERWIPEYMQALCREIELYAEAFSAYNVRSIYLGGGTPSILRIDQVAQLLQTLRHRLSVDAAAEITMEANPSTVDAKKFRALRAAGVTRISLGVQATQDALLLRIGRLHDAKQAQAAIDAALQAGFSSVSADLLYGIPGQGVAEYLESIRAVAKSGVSHISAYALRLDPCVPMYARIREGAYAQPDEDAEYDQYVAGNAYMESLGYGRYEISNYAREGHACWHNVNYWKNGFYLGLGAAAHGCLPQGAGDAAVRYANADDLQKYMDALRRGGKPVAARDAIARAESMFETMMLGLRMPQGIEKQAFQKRYGCDVEQVYGEAIRRCAQKGWLEQRRARLRPTAKGLDFHNAMALCFLQDTPESMENKA